MFLDLIFYSCFVCIKQAILEAMWKKAHPDPEKVIDRSSSVSFSCPEHLMKYVREEMPDLGEAWQTMDHVSVTKPYLFNFFNRINFLIITYKLLFSCPSCMLSEQLTLGYMQDRIEGMIHLYLRLSYS